MLKRITFTLLSLMLTVALYAQKDMPGLYAMPKLGVNIGWISNMDETVTRWTAGMEFDLITESVFGVSAGLNIARQGCVKYVRTRDVVHEIDYITVPIIVVAHVVRGLSLKVGIQPAFVTHAYCWEKLEYVKQTHTFKDYYGQDINKTDVSALFGIAYTFPHGITLEERVCIGGAKILDNRDWKNYAYQFTIGFKTKIL